MADTDPKTGPKPFELKLAPEPEPLVLRSFGDSPTLRKQVYDKAFRAIGEIAPIVGRVHTLSLTDPQWVDPETFSKKEQKAAILEGRTLGRRVKATWHLSDNATGAVVDSKRSIVGRVPFINDHGEITHNGSKYGVNHQQRLKPGIYSMRKENGEFTSHVNSLPGKGFTHHYEFDPETSIFKAKVAQAHIPLFPLLKSQGLTDKDFVDAWGPEIYRRNAVKDDPAAVRKFAAKVLPEKEMSDDPAELHRKLGEYFKKFELDPGVGERNLGERFDHLSPHAMLAATKKLVALSRGEAQSDDRDAPANMVLHGPEDMFAERIRRDHSGIRRKAAWKAFNKGSLDGIPPGLLTKQIEQVLIGSGLAVNFEEVNPAEILDRQTVVSRAGEGGMSGDAIPASSRNVQPGYAGLIDPIRTPESGLAGVNVHFGVNARKGSDGGLYGKFIHAKTGKEEWKKPEDLHDKVLAYPGVMDERNFPFPRVPAFHKGKTVYRKRSEVDYATPHFTTNFSALANLVPMFQSAYAQRMGMGSRMTSQALALENPEAPLVQSAMDDNPDRSYEEHYGGHMGAMRADKGGIVQEVTPDGIRVKHDDGTEKIHELFNEFPMNRKSRWHQTSAVKPLDRVEPGSLIATSNFTDKNGTTALGKNLRAAYLVWKGMNHEDAQVLSESAAKKMTSEHAYQYDHEPTEHHFTGGKQDYVSMFPSRVEPEHLAAMDDSGVVRPGTKVVDGQPLILSARRQIDASNKIIKKKQAGVADDSVKWEGRDPGEVTDVVRTDKGVKVVVKSMSPAREGDKFCYDPETEVLTATGWKPVSCVSLDDPVASLSPEGKIEYLKPAACHAYSHSGRMYRLKNTQVDLLVTDSHKLYVKPRYASDYKRSTYRLVEAKDVYRKRFKLKRNGEWVGRSPKFVTLPAVRVAAGQFGRGFRIMPAMKIPAETYAMILGMFLSEGNTFRAPKKGGYGFDITQVKEPNRQKMLDALTAAGVKFTDNKKANTIRVNSLQWYLHLKPLGLSWEKRIPVEVFSWGPDLLGILYEWMMWGDGGRTGSGHAYYTSSPGLADDVQRLVLHLGLSANIDSAPPHRMLIKGRECDIRARYIVSIFRHKNEPEINYNGARKKGFADSWVDYEGNVYCVTLPKNHVLYVRRNGTPIWCGNSGKMGDKGVARIIPDHEMPVDKEGKPFEILLNPLGLISRVNANQKAELWLSKIAAKTGKPYKVLNFDANRPSLTQYAIDEMKKHGVEPTEDVTDPSTGRRIANVPTGHRFMMKLHHRSEDKLQGRGSGGYSSEGEPAKGGPAGCFVGGALVRSADGESRRIEDLVESQEPLAVVSKGCRGSVHDWMKFYTSPEDLLEIELESGDIHVVTRQHEFIFADGTPVRVGQLAVGDDLLEA